MFSTHQPVVRWPHWRFVQWLLAAVVSLLLFGGAALVAGRSLSPANQGAGAGLFAGAAPPELRASALGREAAAA